MKIFKGLKDLVQGKATLKEKRSSQWAKVRKAHLESHPACALCEGTKLIEVHHIIPFNVDPTKELDPTNLITLCESKHNGVTCHQFFGHLGNYKSFNKNVVADCKLWKGKLKDRP